MLSIFTINKGFSEIIEINELLKCNHTPSRVIHVLSGTTSDEFAKMINTCQNIFINLPISDRHKVNIIDNLINLHDAIYTEDVNFELVHVLALFDTIDYSLDRLLAEISRVLT